MRSDHDAEDVLSETVLQALEGLHRLRDDKAFLSFLFTIATRIVKRQRWRRRLFGEYDEGETMERAHPDALPDEQADVELLRAALQRLPNKMREAVVLFEINGLSLEEIREIQGGSLSGVKSRLVRGRKQLALLLDAEEVNVPLEVSPEPSKQSATFSTVL